MASLLACVPDKTTWAALIGDAQRVTVLCQTHDRANTWKFRKAVASVCVADVFSTGADSGGSAYQKAFVWPVSLGCAAHDAHNGLRWGLQCSCVWSDDTVKDMYICMLALRECYRQVAHNIHGWVKSVLVPVPALSMADRGFYSEVYGLLGLDSDVHALVTDEMQLRWCRVSETLLVNDVWLSTQGWLESVAAVLLDMWRLPSFCASRWIAVGAGSRRLCLSIFTGLEHCVKSLHGKSVISNYSLHGFERYSSTVGVFSLVAGLTAYVPDSLLKQLLHEPALCKIYTECVSQLEDEYLCLEEITPGAWKVLAESFQSDPETIRDMVLLSATTAWGYLDWRVLSVATSLPWSLCLGDTAGNLAELLAQGTPPQEPISLRIWQLHSIGVTDAVLLDGINALQSCAWTSQVSERQHASTSLVKKHHPEYGLESLSSRSWMHFFNNFLFRQNASERVYRHHMQKLARAQRRQPNKCTGRQMFLKELMEGVTASNEDRLARGKPMLSHQRVMNSHGLLWRKMSSERRSTYEAQAS
eukprot:6455568-Amphidinium_carterae.1